MIYIGMMWTAPEIMRAGKDAPAKATQKGDVYSFAIICQELLTRSGPFDMCYYHIEPKGSKIRSCQILFDDFSHKKSSHVHIIYTCSI